MKKIALVIAASIAAASANAAPVTYTVNGTIDAWKSWNAASKAPMPYFVAAAGVDLSQADNNGDSILSAPAVGLQLAVTGSITYDNVTGAISALTLSQVGSWTGWYDTDSDSLADDGMTISGLTWTLDTVNGYLSQTAGSASGCASSSPVCAFTVAGVNANDHSNTASQSVFDFQGINAGFKTLPRSNATNTGYGTVSYKTWAATAGAAGSVTVQAGNDVASIALSSRVNSGAPTTNNGNLATLALEVQEVPVPAAAWLMGSGLVGLAGIARRRKMA